MFRSNAAKNGAEKLRIRKHFKRSVVADKMSKIGIFMNSLLLKPSHLSEQAIFAALSSKRKS